MAAFDFPASPSTNDTYTANGITFVFDGTAWSPALDVVYRTTTQTLSNKTLVTPTINDGFTEEVFTVTGTTPAISPTNGSTQTWALTGASTPTAGTWASGQSIDLYIDDGSANTINWSSMSITWLNNGGAAPTLETTGYTTVVLKKLSSTLYGFVIPRG